MRLYGFNISRSQLDDETNSNEGLQRLLAVMLTHVEISCLFRLSINSLLVRITRNQSMEAPENHKYQKKKVEV